MVYLINGEKSLIDKEVNDLIKKYNTTSIIKYDLVFNKISDVINDINTVNLFSDKKVIICSSINNIDNIDILVKYLDNQNDNILILTNEDKIDLKILNKIKNKNIEKIDLSNIDLTSFIKEEFKDYKISFKEINMLKDYTSNDYNRIKEEIIKLKMYKLDTKEINEDDVKAFLEYSKEHGINRILAHAPYTLNACSADSGIREFAKNTMADDLKRMEYTPGNYYNFHPGSHVGQGVEVGIDFIAEMLNEILTKEQTTTVLLETMSGKGSEVGRNFEELKAIIDKVKLKDKLGVCLDTCHVFDAGYDIVNDLDGVLAEFDSIIGLDRLKAVHLNDSMMPFGGKKDRHAVIGEGEIGLNAIINFMSHPKLNKLPFFLETPLEDEGHKKEIAMIKEILSDK